MDIVDLLLILVFLTAALALVDTYYRRKRAREIDARARVEGARLLRATRARPTSTRSRVRLTAQSLTAVNRQRHITGRPALSSKGFARAIETAPADRRLDSQNDWLLWFLLWDVHSQSRPSDYVQSDREVSNALEIQSGGGEFGGAGATGSWSQERLTDNLSDAERRIMNGGADIADPNAPGAAEAIAAGAAVLGGTVARQTFEVPPGYEAVRDDEGRATGELRKADNDATFTIPPQVNEAFERSNERAMVEPAPVEPPSYTPSDSGSSSFSSDSGSSSSSSDSGGGDSGGGGGGD